MNAVIQEMCQNKNFIVELMQRYGISSTSMSYVPNGLLGPTYEVDYAVTLQACFDAFITRDSLFFRRIFKLL